MSMNPNPIDSIPCKKGWKYPAKTILKPMINIEAAKIVNNHFQKLDFELGHFGFLISGFGSSREVEVDPGIKFASLCFGMTLLIKG